ncbi:MAG: hypothetical protein K2X27_05725 [Candidatus Obscuribacterales bacterium]|nr:hypothetical protein [Candidatus Obscuribacterales bacterium]
MASGQLNPAKSHNSIPMNQSFNPHSFHPEARFLPGRAFQQGTPKIIMSRRAYTLMAIYVELGSQEVGWMGTAYRQPDGNFRIEDVFLFKQTVSPTQTKISGEGISELSMQLVMTQGDAGIEACNNLRFWGHSHVNMDTHPSGTDEATMVKRSFGRSDLFCFQNDHVPFAIRGIFNKRGKAYFSLFLYEEGLRIDDVEWDVDPLPPGSEPAAEFAPPEAPAISASALAALPLGGVVPSLPSVFAANGPEQSSSQAPASPEAARPRFSFPSFGRRTDAKFRPDVNAELMASVSAEFKEKVTEERSFFSWFGEPDERGERAHETEPRRRGFPRPAQELEVSEVEGEASGPGTTGNFGSFRPQNERPAAAALKAKAGATPAGNGGNGCLHDPQSDNCGCSACRNKRWEVQLTRNVGPRPEPEGGGLRSLLGALVRQLFGNE